MVANATIKLQRDLVQRQQPFFQARNCNASPRMRMHHPGCIVAGAVDGRVDGETGRIDLVRAIVELVAFGIDLDQRRRGDLFPAPAIGVDQKGIILVGDPCRDVGIDQVSHAVQRGKAVASRQILTRLPLDLCHVVGANVFLHVIS